MQSPFAWPAPPLPPAPPLIAAAMPLLVLMVPPVPGVVPALRPDITGALVPPAGRVISTRGDPELPAVAALALPLVVMAAPVPADCAGYNAIDLVGLLHAADPNIATTTNRLWLRVMWSMGRPSVG